MNESIATELICNCSKSTIELVIISLGVIISLILLFLILRTFKQTNKIQRENLLNDLVKRDDEIWKKIGKSKKSKKERIINFYEYLSFLVLEKVIDEKPTKKLFENELIDIYEKYENIIIREGKETDFENLINLYKRWKKKGK